MHYRMQYVVAIAIQFLQYIERLEETNTRFRGGKVRIYPGLVLSLLLPLGLSGCFIPPAVSLASLAADGVSLAASGKSLKDHALSEISGEDCAMWRAMKNENICLVDVEPSETILVAYKGPETALDDPWAEPPLSTADMDVMRRGFLHLGEQQRFEQMATMREPSGLTIYAPSTSDAESVDTIGPARNAPAQNIAESAPAVLDPPVSDPHEPAAVSPIARPAAPSAAPSRGLGGDSMPVQVASIAVPKAGVSSLPFDAGAMMPMISGRAAPIGSPTTDLQFFAAATTPSMGQVARHASAEMSAVSQVVTVAAPARESWSDDADTDSATALERSVYLVLGSYAAPEQAKRAAAGFGDLAAHVRAATVGGHARYRVVAGPYVLPEAQARRDNIAGAGVKDAWITRL